MTIIGVYRREFVDDIGTKFIDGPLEIEFDCGSISFHCSTEREQVEMGFSSISREDTDLSRFRDLTAEPKWCELIGKSVDRISPAGCSWENETGLEVIVGKWRIHAYFRSGDEVFDSILIDISEYSWSR